MPDHSLINLNRVEQLLLGHALFERMRHMNCARPDEERLAPLAAERRDIGRKRDDCRRNPIDRAQMQRGNLVSPESPTSRTMISARASSAITLGARPPERVPMLRVLGPSSESTGSGIRRIAASASINL